MRIAHGLLLVWAGLACIVFGISRVNAAVIFTSPFGEIGDLIDRGFYIPSYPGNALGTVQIRYSTSDAGTYNTTLTARLSTYDGALIGSPQTVTFVSNAADPNVVIYDFGGVPVPVGSTVTFSQAITSGPGTVFYDVGMGALGAADPSTGIIETEGTSPPLDMFRRSTVGVIITDTPIPEPASLGLLLLAPLMLLTGRKRRSAYTMN